MLQRNTENYVLQVPELPSFHNLHIIMVYLDK
uniref:Uncharacterized protein n=1 Tax=Arundo donax TaxID=35708 RepID=A0A0A9FKB6_ARUDO